MGFSSGLFSFSLLAAFLTRICFFATFKPDTSSWMNYNGNKSIANISISNPGFAGSILLLRGEIEPSCPECKLLRIEHTPVFTYTPGLLLVFGWLSITPLVEGGFYFHPAVLQKLQKLLTWCTLPFLSEVCDVFNATVFCIHQGYHHPKLPVCRQMFPQSVAEGEEDLCCQVRKGLSVEQSLLWTFLNEYFAKKCIEGDMVFSLIIVVILKNVKNASGDSNHKKGLISKALTDL